MRKMSILLLCCGVLVSMVGCGGNTAQPPTESPPTTVSETVITEAPTETTPPSTAAEPTEKEKEPVPTESEDQATEPTTTAPAPTTTVTEKPKAETKPTETTKATEPSTAENSKENGCITIVETDDPPTEEIIIPPKPSADLVAQKVAEYINQFRAEQGDVTADEIAYSIANGFRNSKGHWSYVGSYKYTYMAVGVMYDGYYWYVCVCMVSENTDLK